MKTILCKTLPLAIAFVIANLLFADRASGQITLAGGSIANAVRTNTTSSTSLTINRPTLAIGDLMLANIVQSDNDNNDGGDLSNAQSLGWTLIAGGQTGIAGSSGDEWWGTLLYKVATASDVAAANFVFTLDGDADDGSGGIMAFRGVNVTGGVTVTGAAGGPFDVTPGTTYNNVNNDNTLNANAISTVTPNAAVIMLAVLGDNVNIGNWTTSSPGVLTELYDLPHNADLDMGSGAAWGIKPTAGSTGGGTASISTAFNGAILIALRPMTITTGTIDGSPFCVTTSAGAAVSVPFTSTGTYTSNTYTAQLSNAAGSFASPTNIGTLVSNANSGTISATIPANTATGTAYRIRVISSSPAITGADNGTSLTINLAAASIAPTTTQTIGVTTNGAPLTVTEGSSPASREWFYGTTSGGPYGTTTGVTTTSFTPNFAVQGTYYLVCVSTFACVTITTNQVQINVLPTISTDPVNGFPLCLTPGVDAAISVSFTSAGTFSGNTYTAQLSNASGSFASPTNIGTLSSDANSGTIDAIIPPNTPTGTGYRIRVISDGPPALVTDNGTNLTITQLPVATFDYTVPRPSTLYCQNLPSNPSPTADPSPHYTGGGVAGTFTASPSGLVFKAGGLPGQVDLAASAPGTYTVTNTIASSGGCPQVQRSAQITVLALPSASISYPAPSAYCQTAGPKSVTLVQGPGLISNGFTASPAGLDLDNATGEISPSTSTPGTYIVTYTFINFSCGNTASATVTITALPVATFSYAASPYCSDAANPSPTFSGGGTAGLFSSSPGLVFVSANTGQINLSASAPGTYTVTNTIVSSGGCPQVQASATVTIIALPIATFSYAASPYCKNAANPIPTLSEGGSAGTFSSTSGLVFVNTGTGEINVASSSAGTYTVTNTIAASSPCGQVQASSTVTISTPPTVAQTSVTVCEGQPASLTSSYTCPGGGTLTEGPRNAGTGSNVNGPGTVPWLNPGNITLNDGNPATAALLSFFAGDINSELLQGTNYGFNIPSNATITGIQVAIRRETSNIILGASINDLDLRLLKGGALVGTNKASTADWPTTFAVANYGATNDLWGTTWTPAQINASNFGVSLSVTNQGILTNRTGSVDFIQITVTYTLPAPGLNWYSVSSGGTIQGSGSTFSPVTTPPGTFPYYAACSSAPDCRTQVDLIIKPKPTVNAITNATYCNTETGAAINFSTPTQGGTPTYHWTSTANVGFGTSGDDNIGSYPATNATSSPVTATVSVAATVNGCTGTATTFTVTVNPTPTLTSTLTPPAICSNTSFSYSPSSATTGTIFSWARAAVAGITNAANSGTGNPNETLVNTTASAINVTYVYSLSASGCTNPNTYNVVVTVNPAPAISTNPSDALKCIGESATFTVIATGMGLTYQWYKAGIVAPLVNIAGRTSGVTTAALTISNIAVADAGDYYVIVTGTCSPAATSSSAHLMVKEATVSTSPATNPVTAQYSDPVKFTAKIYNGASLLTLNPTASATFKISNINVDGAVNIALVVDGSTTNLIAEVTRPLVEVPANPSNAQMSPGSKTVVAYFNNITTPSSGCSMNTNLVITKENAWITYTGDLIKATASSSTTSVTLQLRANILDISVPQTPVDPLQDASPGDIRNARVTFVNRDDNDALIVPANLTPALVDALDPKIGSVSVPFTISGLSSSSPSKQIRIGIIVDNGYYVRNDPNDDVVVTGYIPVGDFITGGGYIIPTESAGSKASDDYRKANFGFNVKFNKTGNNLQGSMNIIFRRTSSSDGLVHNYQIKANAMQSLGVDATNPKRQTAEYVSKVTLKDLTNSAVSDPDVGGNKYLYVKMIDNGEPGVNDSISFALLRGDLDPTILSNIVWSSNWVGSRTQMMNLTGGNLVVHSGFSVGTPSTTSYVNRQAYTEVSDQPFAVKAWPNPAEKFFTLHVTGNATEKVEIKVFDIRGRQVYVNRGAANQDYRFGHAFVTGVYLAEVRQGEKRSLLKLIKQ